MSSALASHIQVEERTFPAHQPAYREVDWHYIQRHERKKAPRTIEPTSKLTRREIEVLQWSADGKTALEIAEILCLSQETIHSHVKNAVQKLQVANKTAAVAQALRTGIFC